MVVATVVLTTYPSPVELWGHTTSGGLVLSQNSKFQIMVMVVVINM